MFESLPWGPVSYDDIDTARNELVTLEATVAAARACQAQILEWLLHAKVTVTEAARSMEEWTAANIDVSPTTARDLVTAARHRHWCPPVTLRHLDGEVTFDRAVAVAHLVKAGGDDNGVAASFDRDLAGVKRRVAELKRVTRSDEAAVMRQRHLTLTPTMGNTAWAVSGILPAAAGQLVAKALQERADRFPTTPDGDTGSRNQRQADALTAWAQDWLDTAFNPDGTATADDTPAGYGSTVTILADAAAMAGSGGELGGTVAGGPRIGPETLERMLCEAAVSVVGVTGGRPITTTARTRAIPPAIRDFVLQRDGGCVIDGCTSRYRLQPHHVNPYGEGGDHDPATLATVCWYHHHIVIHGYGYRLDLDTPPQRRRLTRRPIRPPPYQTAA